MRPAEPSLAAPVRLTPGVAAGAADALPVPTLALRGFGASFGRRVILAEVDLELPEGGVDVLMGPVHTGKSTLLRSLAGLNHPNRLFRCWGEALLQGRPLAEGWRPALVQQHATVLHASVREALVFHARRLRERSGGAWTAFADEALARHGLAPLLQGGPDAPLLSQPPEVQRAVNILSHALAAPPLLLVDEPTFGLDELAATRLVEWLADLGRTQRLLVALHHQGQARRLAARVVLLGGGRVQARDANPRFFTHPANAWADQFVRTGSMSIPSPDARPEDLASDVAPPPALPEAALRAIAEFLQPAAEAAVPLPAAAVPATAAAAARVQPVAAQPAVAAQVQPAAVPASVSVPAPVPAAMPAPAAPARLAPLPAASRDGVEAASMVGYAIMAEYRAPPGFHWINPGRLAGCAEPGIARDIGYDLDLLKGVGITHLVTLTEKDLDQEALATAGLKNLHLPVYDREAPSLSQAYMLVRRMQVLLDQGHTLAVHCKAGIGRTGTVLACWLIREGGLSADSAIARLRMINRSYVQTEMQERFLADLEQDIIRRLH